MTTFASLAIRSIIGIAVITMITNIPIVDQTLTNYIVTPISTLKSHMHHLSWLFPVTTMFSIFSIIMLIESYILTHKIIIFLKQHLT
jgi:hypothetical protein